MKPNPSRRPRSSLTLQHFLPYRLSVLTNTISSTLARQYQQRFDLTIPQWRVMAVLAGDPGLSAIEVGERAAMDKVSVSRAVAGLHANRRLLKKMGRGDRRRSNLRLSARGQAVYQQIVPLAQHVENSLLEALSERDRVQLDRLLRSLSVAAESLAEGGSAACSDRVPGEVGD